MRRLRKWLSLPASEKRLFGESLLLLAVIRLALWLLPFQKVHDSVARYREKKRSVASREIAPAIVGDFVARSARLVPRATCLTQALATQVILARRGHSSVLRFGGKKKAGGFEAHAWVEIEGRIIIGEPALGEFSDFKDRQ